MPTAQECPRLRPGLAAAPDRQHPQLIILSDQLGLGRQPQRLNVLEFSSVQLFNGRNTLREIQAETMRQLGGVLLPLDFFVSLVERLDAALQPRPRAGLYRHLCAGTRRRPPSFGKVVHRPSRAWLARRAAPGATATRLATPGRSHPAY